MDIMTRDLTLPVEGMDCRSCEMNIEFALSSLPGVQRAKADHKAGRVEVSWDPKLTDEVSIRRAIDAMGFRIATG